MSHFLFFLFCLSLRSRAAPSALEKPPETIVIESGHIVLQPGPDGLGVLEVLNLENRGETYEGIAMGPGAKISLRFPVPQGAQDLAASPESGPDFISVGSALAYVKSLPPGKKSVVFSYRLPWAGGGVTFKRFYRYGVEHMSLMAEAGSLKLAIQGARKSESLDLQGRSFEQYHVQGLKPEQEIGIQAKPGEGASPSPMMGSMSGGDSHEGHDHGGSGGSGLPSPAVMLGMITAAVLLASGAYMFGYARGRALGTEKPDPEGLKRSLVAELAVLDDRHDKGGIPDGEWKSKREALKAKLLSLMETQKT